MKTILKYQPNINGDSIIEDDATIAESSATKKMNIKTNRDLAEDRLQVYRAKREARQKSIESSNERNYHLKELLHGSTTYVDSLQTNIGDVMSQPTSITSKSNEIVGQPPLIQLKY